MSVVVRLFLNFKLYGEFFFSGSKKKSEIKKTSDQTNISKMVPCNLNADERMKKWEDGWSVKEREQESLAIKNKKGWGCESDFKFPKILISGSAVEAVGIRWCRHATNGPCRANYKFLALCLFTSSLFVSFWDLKREFCILSVPNDLIQVPSHVVPSCLRSCILVKIQP